MEFSNNNDDLDICLDLCDRSLKLCSLLSNNYDIKIATLNNCSFIYKECGKLEDAVIVSKEAIELTNNKNLDDDIQSSDIDEIACSHLALSTVYHEQGSIYLIIIIIEYKEALEEARISVSKILEYIIPIENKYDDIDEYSEVLKTLCIGYQHIGNELEKLNRIDESVNWYKVLLYYYNQRGLLTCQEYIGNEELLKTLSDSYKNILKVLKNKSPKKDPFLKKTEIKHNIPKENSIKEDTNVPNISHIGNSDFLSPDGKVILTRNSHIPSVIRPKKPLYLPSRPSNTPYNDYGSIIQQLYLIPKPKRVQSATSRNNKKITRSRPLSAYP